MKTIEFENKVFYALKGFDGYFASMNGEVLGTKKGMKLLKCSMGICQAYSLCRHNKITKVTKARIAGKSNRAAPVRPTQIDPPFSFSQTLTIISYKSLI